MRLRVEYRSGRPSLRSRNGIGMNAACHRQVEPQPIKETMADRVPTHRWNHLRARATWLLLIAAMPAAAHAENAQIHTPDKPAHKQPLRIAYRSVATTQAANTAQIFVPLSDLVAIDSSLAAQLEMGREPMALPRVKAGRYAR